MQAQRARTEVQAISSTQSLATVQTLLKAGLGCIAFLRNLLPEDNFNESHFTTDDSFPCDSFATSFSSTETTERRQVNGFKIMTMARGYTDEADRILNYLEYGIFDALQKQYLRSFIFAIYLDSKDPSNIVEAYTFNFQYHTIPGTNIVVPVLSLGDDLRNMSLNDARRPSNDPLSETVKRGKVPTIKDVKKSVKALLKTLIHVMSQMDDLPRRRYATFKVFYTDKTPADYEPPHFQAGDTEKDKWFFMTHDLDEIPDKWSIGKLKTGHHSVNLTVASIAGYLPSSTEQDHATFTGTTSDPISRPTLTPVQEAIIRAQQADKQSQDAESRNIVWSAEEDLELGDADAEGEDDPEYVRQSDGRYEKVKATDALASFSVPLGVRNSDGEVKDLPAAVRGSEALFGGESEDVPRRLKEINLEPFLDRSAVEETQTLTIITQEMSLSSPPLGDSPSNLCQETSSITLDLQSDPTSLLSPMAITSTSVHDAFTHISKSTATASTMETDDYMETQRGLHADSQIAESIQSFGADLQVDSIEEDARTPRYSTKTATDLVVVDNGLQCDCGVSIEDASCFCEGGCGRWYHLWCMGYHSVQDARIPSKFVCFDCRVHADLSWELLKVDLYPKMIAKFRELALFRRAIKVAEREKSGKLVDFAKSFGGDSTLTRQLLKRLETEGFVAEQITTLDELGFTTTISRSKNKGKTKAKQPRPRRNVQKPQYAFNRPMKTNIKYSNYFDPDPKVENQMLGLSDLKVNSKSRNQPTPILIPDMLAPQTVVSISPQAGYNETQTQDEEIQAPIVSRDGGLKRIGTMLEADPMARPKKKVKISVTAGVDLAE